MFNIKALLFDMDGVLIDAKDWHYRSLNMALAKFNAHISYDDHLEFFDGKPTRVKLRILAERGWVDESDFHEIADIKQNFTLQLARENCRPIFQHQVALSNFQKEGYRIVVCSNAVRQSVDMMMNLSGLANFLEFTLSNEDIVQPKPAPDIYLKAMGIMGLPPKNCLIIEDSKTGLQAARAAGAAVLKVNDVSDVNYDDIRCSIAAFENYAAAV